MPKYTMSPIASKPGIQRDGTPYHADAHIAGQWVRWYEGVARKIGGYQQLIEGNTEPVRNMFSIPLPGNKIRLILGRPSTLSYIDIDADQNLDGSFTVGPEVNITPAQGFDPNPNNVWDFDIFPQLTQFSTVPNTPNGSFLVAQVSPLINDPNVELQTTVFYGPIPELLEEPLPGPMEALLPIPDPEGGYIQCSGGICCVPPSVVIYGDNGQLRWCSDGDITSWPGDNTLLIANVKLVHAFRTYAGDTPNLLVWSLNSLLKVARVGTKAGDPHSNADFGYSTIEENISILSSDSIVKINQMFFWPGVDQFYFYNGIAQKLQNTMNNTYFFNNINKSLSEKVYAVAVPQYKEIWWFFPYNILNEDGTTTIATENNAVIIHNIESTCWYDSLVNRSGGIQASIFQYPIFSDSQPNINGNYPIWIHEIGVDQVINYGENDPRNSISPISSFYQSHWIDMWSNNPSNSNYLKVRRVAPDFAQDLPNQNGVMSLRVLTKEYAGDVATVSDPYYFNSNNKPSPPNPVDPNEFGALSTTHVDLQLQGALVSFIFESNVIGGNYQAGKVLFFYEAGDTFR